MRVDQSFCRIIFQLSSRLILGGDPYLACPIQTSVRVSSTEPRAPTLSPSTPHPPARFLSPGRSPQDQRICPEGQTRRLSQLVGSNRWRSYGGRLQTHDCLIGLNCNATNACGESDLQISINKKAVRNSQLRHGSRCFYRPSLRVKKIYRPPVPRNHNH